MIRKIENAVIIVLVFGLSLLPLTLRFIQEGVGFAVKGADIAQFNIVFLFSCVAGIATWREDRHLSLASLSDKAPEKVKQTILRIRTAAVVAILCTLFFTAFSEAFLAFEPQNKVWGIPLTLIFAFLPLMYLFMLGMALFRSQHRVSAIIGLLIGLYMSLGPLTGVLYSLFEFDVTTYPLLYGISNSWLDFSAVAIFPIVVLMILLALCGVPLFIVISGIAYAAFSQGGGYVEEISLASYHILTDKSIAAIPLFTIAGYILAKGSAGQRLVDVFKSLFGWFRGGMVVAAVIVITFFTTFTGVSGVTILALGGLLTLVLAGNGYNKENAESLITASGATGLLFPPSMAIIVYATTNYMSVNVYDLFKGALGPGILMAVSMMVIGIVKDKQTDRPKFSFPAIGKAMQYSVFELLLPVCIVIGYFTGLFSLIEVASFTVVYTFCLETFIRRDFSFRKALSIVAESVPVAGGVLIILSASKGLSVFLIDAGVPGMLSDFIISMVDSKYLFLLLLNIALLFVGCLMDLYSAILVVSPLIIPMAEMFGIHPVHIGVVFLMNLQLGFLTPPVGMDLFIASYAFDTPVMKVVKGILPYLLIQFVVLMLVTYIPVLSTLFVR